MKTRKTDWTLVREAEEQGLVVSMTGIVERNRTDLNNELSDYFNSKLPDYEGGFDEEKSENILYEINEYIEENNIDKFKRELDFPITSGTVIHLIPITDNLEVKIMISDEYFGDGEYEKFIDLTRFIINEDTTKEDVDQLIDFVEEHLK